MRADFPAIFRLFDKDDADLQFDDAWDLLDLVGPKDEEHVAEIVRIISSRTDQMEKRMWSYSALQHIRGRDQTFRDARAAALRAGPLYAKVWIRFFGLLHQFNSKPGEPASPSDLAKLSLVFASVPLICYAIWLVGFALHLFPSLDDMPLWTHTMVTCGWLVGPIAVVVGFMSFVQKPKGLGGLGIILGIIAATIGFSSWPPN